MKKLEKDFILAWILGMALPGLLLVLVVGTNGNRNSQPGEEWSASLEITTLPPSIFIPVLSSDGVVTEMDLEVYLCGVVLAEMPADFELEALKAQSVVARTYALRRFSQGTKHPGGAVCTDASCCQGYIPPEDYRDRGGELPGISKVTQAVLATAGEVLTYGGELIEATYFSCSGGTTEDALTVWGTDVPYLRSTVSPGEENAKYHEDTASFMPAEIADRLGISLKGDPKDWFVVRSYTNGGSVEEIEVCGRAFTGVEIRKLLSLRSTDFTVTATEKEIMFHTKGYGHRVGMSQYGADAMALAGNTYDQILAHYYQGTSLGDYEPED